MFLLLVSQNKSLALLDEASWAAVQSDLDIHSKHITVHVRALHSGNFLGYILNIMLYA